MQQKARYNHYHVSCIGHRCFVLELVARRRSTLQQLPQSAHTARQLTSLCRNQLQLHVDNLGFCRTWQNRWQNSSIGSGTRLVATFRKCRSTVKSQDRTASACDDIAVVCTELLRASRCLPREAVSTDCSKLKASTPCQLGARPYAMHAPEYIQQQRLESKLKVSIAQGLGRSGSSVYNLF